MISDVSQYLVISLSAISVLQDLLSRKVSNRILLVGLSLILIHLVYTVSWAQFFSGLASGLMVFGIGFVFWRFKVLGAGDVKLMSIIALTFSWQRSLEFVFFSFLWGSVLGLIALGLDKHLVREARLFNFHPLLTIRSSRVKGHKVPFTVGIMLGVLTIWMFESKGVQIW